MQLQTGLSGGGMFGAAFPGSAGTNAGASPQGPSTAAAAGFGVDMGSGSGSDAKTTGVLSVGTLALVALVFIWWSLPR